MSSWTCIAGTIAVSPIGRTQAEKRYILDTVLSHLPLVTGSEGNMNTYVIQKKGHSSICSHDEFGQYSNLGNGERYGKHSCFAIQDKYIIVVDAALRDREFSRTLREFLNWMNRLAKRVLVDDVLVEISGYEKHLILRNNNDVYGEMFENPSWCDSSKEPTWCEYMMYDCAKNSWFPVMLEYKYYTNEENDAEAERRLNYGN